jgi:hypothetical protein
MPLTHNNFPRACAALLFSILIAIVPAWAHVGNPDVYFQGVAGPYHLIVTIRTPQMVPGTAEVEILSSTPGVSKITVVPLFIVGPGAEHPPVGDLLSQSKEDPQYFSGKIWLMESGSWQVRVQVEGTQGAGELAVPVEAAARRTLPMQHSLGILLFALMTLLVVAIISIVGAARRESMLEPGQIPSPANSRSGRWVMVGAAIVVFLLLFTGNRWWDSEALAKARQMIYQPPPMDVSLDPGGKLLLRMGNSAWHSRRPETVMTNLIPDHGHLMHLFLIREPGLDRFYHLHPSLRALPPGLHPINGLSFETDLPAIPAGRYQVFGDVVRESGFADTMIAEINLPDVPGVPLTGDNSAAAAPPLSPGNSTGSVIGASASGAASNANSDSGIQVKTNASADGMAAILPDGYRMVWERGTAPITANHFLWLRFRLETPDGKPVPDMEPYMGMAGHAEIVSSDRSVFAHIHPDGSVAMAALELAQKNLSPQNGCAASGQQMSMSMNMSKDMNMTTPPPSSEVAFPYGFPKAGDYRIFVQMKHGGKIETGVFDTQVIP